MLGIDRSAARYTWTAAMVLLFLYLIYLVRSTLFIFALALLFAYLLSPLVNLLDRAIPKERTRTLALALAYVIFIGGVVLFGVQIGTSRRGAGRNPGRATFPKCWRRSSSPRPWLPAALNAFKAQVIAGLQQDWVRRSGDLMRSLPAAGLKFLSVASNLIYVVIVPVLAFFFLKDGDVIRTHALEMLDAGSLRGVVDSVMSDIHLLLAQYMRALVLLSLATFTAYSIFFTIMGVPFGILLAVVAMMLEFIPMIGPLTAAVLILLVARDLWLALLDGADFPGGLPHVSGLLPLAAPDGSGCAVASPAGVAGRFRGSRSGRRGWQFSLRPGAGDGAHSLRENPAFAREPRPPSSPETSLLLQ